MWYRSWLCINIPVQSTVPSVHFELWPWPVVVLQFFVKTRVFCFILFLFPKPDQTSISPVKMLIGTSSRFIAGRNVIQTVYWRTSGNGDRLIKTNKTVRKLGNTKPTLEQTPQQIDSIWIPKQQTWARRQTARRGTQCCLEIDVHTILEAIGARVLFLLRNCTFYSSYNIITMVAPNIIIIYIMRVCIYWGHQQQQ